MGAKKGKDDSKIVKAAKHVNRKIHQYVKEHNLKAMGTTLVCLRMDPNCPSRGMVFNAGDSRAYRIRNNSVEQLTNDHSYARKVNIDEQFLTPRQRNSLTNAIGIGKKCYLERTDVGIRTGDLFILCSDGLYRSVNNELLLQTCNDYANKSSEELCRQLIQLALDAGGRDNVSVVVVKVLSTGNVPFMARWKHKEQDHCERIDIGWQNHLTPHTV